MERIGLAVSVTSSLASLGAQGHRNCHENIVGALRPLGVQEHEVPLDTFNVCMVVTIFPTAPTDFVRR